jgi:hypothetical protein
MVSQSLINIITILIGLLITSGIGYSVYKKFKKNQSKKTIVTKNKEQLSEKYKYRVELATVMGQSIRIVRSFPVMKVRNDKGVVVLRNESENFEEFFPRDEPTETEYDLAYVNKKIKELESKKKQQQNPFNLKEELFKWKRIKQSLELPGGSFIKFDSNGVPTFLFVEHRSVLIPYKHNVNMSHVHAPSEPFVKKVVDFLIEKKTKYQEKVLQFQQMIVTIGMVVMLVMFIVNGIWSYNNYSWADDSNFAELQKRIDEAPLICAELYGKSGENFYTASEDIVKAAANAVNITEVIRDDLYSNPDIKKNIETQVVK